MSHTINDMLPASVHLMDILRGVCTCTEEAQETVIETVVGQSNKYASLVFELKRINRTSPIGQEIDLTKDLLEYCNE